MAELCSPMGPGPLFLTLLIVVNHVAHRVFRACNPGCVKRLIPLWEKTPEESDRSISEGDYSGDLTELGAEIPPVSLLDSALRRWHSWSALSPPWGYSRGNSTFLTFLGFTVRKRECCCFSRFAHYSRFIGDLPRVEGLSSREYQEITRNNSEK